MNSSFITSGPGNQVWDLQRVQLGHPLTWMMRPLPKTSWWWWWWGQRRRWWWYYKYVILWLVVLTTNKCCLRSFGLCFILINQWTLTFDERMMISGCWKPVKETRKFKELYPSPLDCCLILHVWRKNTMIQQTNKIGNFVFALKDLAGTPFPHNKWPKTPMRWTACQSHFRFIIYNFQISITLLFTLNVTNINKWHHLYTRWRCITFLSSNTETGGSRNKKQNSRKSKEFSTKIVTI